MLSVLDWVWISLPSLALLYWLMRTVVGEHCYTLASHGSITASRALLDYAVKLLTMPIPLVSCKVLSRVLARMYAYGDLRFICEGGDV
jgi:hypothetical protein